MQTSAVTEREQYPQAELSRRIIGCAIEVHRNLGPGLQEGAYENALCLELGAAGLRCEQQVCFPVMYKGRRVDEHRLDLLVEDAVVVEVKSVAAFDPIFTAQVLTYLRVTGKEVGLLFNFNSKILMEGGFKRLIL